MLTYFLLEDPGTGLFDKRTAVAAEFRSLIVKVDDSNFAHILFGRIGQKHRQICVEGKRGGADAQKTAHAYIFRSREFFQGFPVIVCATQLQRNA